MSSREDILETVTAIIDLLTAHGDVYVVKRLRADRDRLERHDPGARRSLLSEATGSMGSLRDRYLSAGNGDRVAEAERENVNTRLGALVALLAQQTQPARTSDLQP